MEQKGYSDIRVESSEKVTRIVINRPNKLNAIRLQTYSEIIEVLQAADKSPHCQVIVIMGEAGNFTAGNDLADLIHAEQEKVVQAVQGIFNTVAALKKPLVAVVEGVAVGIGTTLLLHADLAVATTSVQFRLPFVNLGVGPEGGASSLLPKAIGEKVARELLLTGRFFTGQEALSWGLVNGLAEPGKAADLAEEYIHQLLKQPLASLVATKELMRNSRGDISWVIAAELSVFADLLNSKDTRERINSLLKR